MSVPSERPPIIGIGDLGVMRMPVDEDPMTVPRETSERIELAAVLLAARDVYL